MSDACFVDGAEVGVAAPLVVVSGGKFLSSCKGR